MGLKTPHQYIESLRDGRVIFWGYCRTDQTTAQTRFDGMPPGYVGYCAGSRHFVALRNLVAIEA
jgi:hypothetical protein